MPTVVLDPVCFGQSDVQIKKKMYFCEDVLHFMLFNVNNINAALSNISIFLRT